MPYEVHLQISSKFKASKTTVGATLDFTKVLNKNDTGPIYDKITLTPVVNAPFHLERIETPVMELSRDPKAVYKVLVMYKLVPHKKKFSALYWQDVKKSLEECGFIKVNFETFDMLPISKKKKPKPIS